MLPGLLIRDCPRLLPWLGTLLTARRREYVVQVLMKVVEGTTVDDAVNIMQEAHVNGLALVAQCAQVRARLPRPVRPARPATAAACAPVAQAPAQHACALFGPV